MLSDKPTFGPGGNGGWFYRDGGKSTVQAPAWLEKIGLDAYEYEAGRGVVAGEESLRAVGEAAAAHGIRMSLHAPYFISLSGAVDVCKLERYNLGNARYWESVFGPAEQNVGSENDLFALAERCPAEKRPEVFMWCGEQDGLLGDNIRLRDHLTGLGYDLTYTQSPGDHQWKYWDEQIQNVLAWIYKDR